MCRNRENKDEKEISPVTDVLPRAFIAHENISN